MQFSVLVILNLISASFCTFFIIHFAKNLKIQSKKHVLLLLSILLLWTIISIVDMFTSDIKKKLILTNIGYIAYALIAPCWIGFVRSFILHKSKDRGFLLAICYLIGITFILLNWLNPASLFYSSVEVSGKNGHSVFMPKYGIVFWLHWIYSFLLLTISLPWMAFITIRGGMEKSHFVLLVAAITAPTITNLFYTLGLFYYDCTPASFWVTAWLVYFLHKKQFFSRLSLSHNSIINNMNMGYILLGEDLQLLEINDAAKRILCLANTYTTAEIEELITNKWKLSPEIIDSGDTLRSLCTLDGATNYYRITANKLKIVGQENECLALFIQDETDLQLIRKRIHYLERYDEPTGLYNRTYFFDLIEKELARLDASSKHIIALACIQVMNYHNYCTLFGNEMGDLIIAAVSDAFESVTHSKDVLCRKSPSELCMFMRLEKTDDVVCRLENIIEKTLTKLENPIRISGNQIRIRLKIGVALAPKHANNTRDLLGASSIALQSIAKFAIKPYNIYQENSGENFARRLKLDRDIHKAIDDNQLFVLYQPQVDIRSGIVAGVEALVRWNHPKLGFIAPSEFIPLAEENGYIQPLGLWVIKQAVCQLKKWEAMGLTELKVSVNVSLNQLPDPSFSDNVIKIVRSAGINPARLELELTESIALFPEAMVHGHLESLRQYGIRIAMDDFGMGHSSLAFIKDFEPSTIKIDRALSSDLMVNPASIAMIRSVQTLCKSLDVDTVVEYIEHKEQLDILKELQCYIVQGFYFSRPLRAEDCTDYIINASTNNQNFLPS